MPVDARIAVYYAPRFDDPLWTLGATWLGRDPETGAMCRQPDIPGIFEATADPRGYAFHATLKPPMRLRETSSWEAVVADAEKIAAEIAPFDLPPLKISDIHGFLALRETFFSAALQGLADAFVAGLDSHREPPSEAELERRRRGGRLTAEQDAMLVRWGYPYVFSTWFFHMTLTRRLTAEEHAVFRPAAEAYFAEGAGKPRRVEDVCLYTQAAAGAPFNCALRIPLRGATLK
jgi:hypothetical protein